MCHAEFLNESGWASTEECYNLLALCQPDVEQCSFILLPKLLPLCHVS